MATFNLVRYLVFTTMVIPCIAQSNSEKKSPKTIIVGGGMAGLSAAAYLEQNGAEDYVILEATKRTGGRIKSITLEQDGIEYAMDMGAGWIHGTTNNPLYEIAKKNDLLKPNSWSNENKNARFTEYETEVWQDSNKIPANVWQPVQASFDAADEAAAGFYKKGLPDGYTTSSSVESYILQKFYDQFNGTSDSNKWRMQRSLLESRMLYQTWDEACDSMNEISLKYYGQYVELPGEDVPLPKGFESIVDVVKKDVPSAKIKFNHVVEKIIYSTSKSTVTVKCKNGQTFEADHVIVTASLGYLKSNAATMFDPPLSGDKMAAIGRMGFGTADRIIVEFDNLDFIENEDVGEIFFARDPQSLRDPKIWQNKVFICYVMDVPKANTLTFWVTGKQAEEMEKKTEEEVYTTIWQLLQQQLGTKVPPPTKMLRSQWFSEEFVKGSYSHPAVGTPVVDDIKMLAKPIYYAGTNGNKPIVMFAGEATHLEYHSSAHGAYESGIREAKRIAATSKGTSSAMGKLISNIVFLTTALVIFELL